MSAIQQEFVKVTKIKVDKYEDRQDFLAAVVKYIGDEKKFTEDDFDKLTDEAADWFNKGATALGKRKEIPDFPDAEAEEAEADEPDDDTEAEASEDDDAPDEEEAEAEEAEADEPEGDEDHEADAEAEAANEEAEAQADKKASAKKNGKKVTAKKAAAKPEKEKPAKPAKKVKDKKIDPERYAEITGETDRFGIIKGTKTSDAVAMYASAKGATSGEIIDKLGGRHYNVLRRLKDQGHRVEKFEGGRWHLTHKEDLAKPGKKGK